MTFFSKLEFSLISFIPSHSIFNWSTFLYTRFLIFFPILFLWNLLSHCSGWCFEVKIYSSNNTQLKMKFYTSAGVSYSLWWCLFGIIPSKGNKLGRTERNLWQRGAFKKKYRSVWIMLSVVRYHIIVPYNICFGKFAFRKIIL